MSVFYALLEFLLPKAVSCVSSPPNSRECREQALCSFRTFCVARADWVAPYGGEKRDNARAYARASAVFLFFAFTSSPFGLKLLSNNEIRVKASPCLPSPFFAFLPSPLPSPQEAVAQLVIFDLL